MCKTALRFNCAKKISALPDGRRPRKPVFAAAAEDRLVQQLRGVEARPRRLHQRGHGAHLHQQQAGTLKSFRLFLSFLLRSILGLVFSAFLTW